MRLDELRSNPDKNPKHAMIERLLKYKGREDVFISFTADVGLRSHAGSADRNRYTTINWQHNGKTYTVHLNIEGTKWDWYDRNFPKSLDPETLGALLKFLDQKFRGKRNRNVSGAKIGINPKSGYNTPLGIYCYPIDHVISYSLRSEDAGIGAEFTGADAWKFAWIIQSRLPEGNTLNMADATQGQANTVRENMMMALKDMPEDDAKALLDRAIEEAKTKSPAGHIWNMTRLAAGRLTTGGRFDFDNDDIADVSKKAAIKWASLLRACGFGLAVDPGKGLIHSNEPTQAVFFDPTAFNHLDLITRSDAFERQITRVTGSTKLRREFIAKPDLDKENPYVLYKVAMSWIGWDLHGAIEATMGADPEHKDKAMEAIKAVAKKLRVALQASNPTLFDCLIEATLRNQGMEQAEIMQGGKFDREACINYVRMSNYALENLKEQGYEIDDALVMEALKYYPHDTARFIDEKNYQLDEASLMKVMKACLADNNYVNRSLINIVERNAKGVEVIDRLVRLYPKLLLKRMAERVSARTLYMVLRRDPKLILMSDPQDNAKMKLPENAWKSILKDLPSAMGVLPQISPELQLSVLKSVDDGELKNVIARWRETVPMHNSVMQFLIGKGGEVFQTLLAYVGRNQPRRLVAALDEKTLFHGLNTNQDMARILDAYVNPEQWLRYAKAGYTPDLLSSAVVAGFTPEIVATFVEKRPEGLGNLLYKGADVSAIPNEVLFKAAMAGAVTGGSMPHHNSTFIMLLQKGAKFTPEEFLTLWKPYSQLTYIGHIDVSVLARYCYANTEVIAPLSRMTNPENSLLKFLANHNEMMMFIPVDVLGKLTMADPHYDVLRRTVRRNEIAAWRKEHDPKYLFSMWATIPDILGFLQQHDFSEEALNKFPDKVLNNIATKIIEAAPKTYPYLKAKGLANSQTLYLISPEFAEKVLAQYPD